MNNLSFCSHWDEKFRVKSTHLCNKLIIDRLPGSGVVVVVNVVVVVAVVVVFNIVVKSAIVAVRVTEVSVKSKMK